MTLKLYLAYLVATTIVLVVPGPTIMLVVGYALAEGRRGAFAIVAGVGLGDLVAATVSLAGLGALLAASATLFTVLKFVGAAYLVWLGVKLWRSEPKLAAPEDADLRRSDLEKGVHAFVVTALNPKGIAFFIAFLPQFVYPGASLVPQLVLLGGTFVVLGVVNAALYALLAGWIRVRIQRPTTLRLINRAGGSVLIGAGLLTAAMRRTA